MSHSGPKWTTLTGGGNFDRRIACARERGFGSFFLAVIHLPVLRPEAGFRQ